MIDTHHLATQPSAVTLSFALGLKKSMAGIYYLPFQQVRQCQTLAPLIAHCCYADSSCLDMVWMHFGSMQGVNLFFRFSGQSIPNRCEPALKPPVLKQQLAQLQV